MATFHGQTVDVYEDFEDALSGSWTITDTDNNVDTQAAAAAKVGSKGLLFNMNGDTAGAENAYAGYDIGAAKTEISVGFWFKGDAYTDTSHDCIIWGHTDQQINMGGYISILYYSVASSQHNIRLRGATFDDGINISGDTWYWITVLSHSGSTCTVNVYNEAESLVGTASVTGNTQTDCDSITFGQEGPQDEDTNMYFDEFIADWTDATFPLLGWDVAGGDDIVILRRRRQ